MRIALVQQNYKVGDTAGNAAKIRAAIAFASSEGADMAVMGADAVTGTPLLGLAESARFREQAARELAGLEAFAASRGVRLVLSDTECEGVKIVCAADHFRHGVAEANRERIAASAVEEGRPVVWVNAVGAQTGTIYYGGSCVAYPSGKVLALPLFEEAMTVIDTEGSAVCGVRNAVWGDRVEQLHRALVLGVRDYFAKTGCRDACVAMSGGIDSALVLALAAEALGAEHVKTVMLPSEYSTDHSVTDSEEMIRRVGIPQGRSWLVSIARTFDAAREALRPVLLSAAGAAARGLAEENMQARIRLMMTMALANSHGALMLNTSNKSEAAVGYGTLYGDTSGALSVIGDVYKGDVYALARQINGAAVGKGGVAPIPEHILTKAPSAELRPGQKDSDSLPDYPVLDAILVRLVEGGKSSEEVIAEGYDRGTVERVCRLLLAGDFKRFQLPPALRVSGCTFGVEWRWPITAAKVL
ncbi:NAD(+) synthase [uncultured Rikenella sp.]|uniref:NAD(+) synthase n=1 Tax=uncultured Rikenella sp. TaxID=368003 RepID=UPI0026312DD8|nr:NAD(+) synthase [uncultured Rikenella sp.]